MNTIKIIEENFPKLYLDYLNDFENVKQYYYKNFRLAEDLFETMQQVMNSTYHQRDKLVDILIKQYKGYSVSEKTLKNIESLNNKNTFAIITGQQAGMLGGPLYNIYKIFTAIKLTEVLNEKFEEFNFVPVFWMEVEDHDFDEIRYFNFLGKNYDFCKVKYDDIEKFVNRGSTGNIIINNKIKLFFDEIKSSILTTQFTNDIISSCENIYSEGKTIGDAFKEILFQYFDKYGLIIFNSLDTSVKQLLKPVFNKEISNYIEHSVKLVSISAELEANYHSQIKIRPINLFYSKNNLRYPIEPTENNTIYSIKNLNNNISLKELLEEIEKKPENFSPNVVLRPICQDYIFPTVYYVAGPGEVSYFAQILSIYENFNIVRPIIYPRVSATLLESSNSKRMEKLHITMEDVFVPFSKFIELILEKNTENNILNSLNDAYNNFILDYEKVKKEAIEFDKNLNDNFNKTINNIEHSLNILIEKIKASQQRKNEELINQAKRVYNSLYPQNDLQERNLYWIYFVNKYGDKFIEHIYNSLKINLYSHQVITINPQINNLF